MAARHQKSTKLRSTYPSKQTIQIETLSNQVSLQAQRNLTTMLLARTRTGGDVPRLTPTTMGHLVKPKASPMPITIRISRSILPGIIIQTIHSKSSTLFIVLVTALTNRPMASSTSLISRHITTTTGTGRVIATLRTPIMTHSHDGRRTTEPQKSGSLLL